MMRTMALVIGWTLRASAAICIVWTAGRVVSGDMTTLGQIVEAAIWHAGFALSGVALVGAAAPAEATAQAAA